MKRTFKAAEGAKSQDGNKGQCGAARTVLYQLLRRTGAAGEYYQPGPRAKRGGNPSRQIVE